MESIDYKFRWEVFFGELILHGHVKPHNQKIEAVIMEHENEGEFMFVWAISILSDSGGTLAWRKYDGRSKTLIGAKLGVEDCFNVVRKRLGI